MASPRVSGDLPLALVLLTAGAASALVASRQSAVAFHFLPSMDGCLTAGCVGFLLALLSGASYRRALFMLLPIVSAQVLGARVHGASLFSVLGIEAMVVGGVGVVLAMHASSTARSPANPAITSPAPRRPRPSPAA